MRASHFFASLAAIGMLLPVMASAAFVDVGPTDVHATAILYVQDHGIVSGYSDGTFKPNASINRAEFTKIIIGAYSSAQLSSCDTSRLYFTDINTSAWYASYLCVAVLQGIIGGYPDNTFRPTASINFAEAAKIIAIADMHGVTEEPANGAAWYTPYTDYLFQNNASASIGDPNHKLTRGEMTEIIYRLSLKHENTASSAAEVSSAAMSSNTISSAAVSGAATMKSSISSAVHVSSTAVSSKSVSSAVSSSTASVNAVSISGFSFGPKTITVKAGTKVTWSNDDSVPHTVTGDNGGPASPILQPGQSYAYTFATPGTFSYHCGVHPGMTGVVTVTP